MTAGLHQIIQRFLKNSVLPAHHRALTGLRSGVVSGLRICCQSNVMLDCLLIPTL